MKFPIYALALLLAACSTVKPMGGAVAGAGVGTLVGGPVGGAVGAAVGAGGGALWQEMSATAIERDECKATLEQMRVQIIDLKATVRANAQIDTYNVTSKKSVPHVEPTPDGDKSHLAFWIAFAVVLAVLGGTAAYIFRYSLGPWVAKWWLHLSDAVRGRAPSAPKPTPAPTDSTPLNQEP